MGEQVLSGPGRSVFWAEKACTKGSVCQVRKEAGRPEAGR